MQQEDQQKKSRNAAEYSFGSTDVPDQHHGMASAAAPGVSAERRGRRYDSRPPPGGVLSHALHGSREGGFSGSSPMRTSQGNANFLLNFQTGYGGYAQSGMRGRPTPRGGSRGRGQAARFVRPQPYDRLKFLQANFRFLVSDAAETQSFEADPDLMVDWEAVVSVEQLSADPVVCPITLETPLCPVLTPCGHIFDFPAIARHHMDHGGAELRRTAPCPLCFAPVAARELRLAVVRPVKEAKVGGPVQFTLLWRRRDSIIPQVQQPGDRANRSTQSCGEGVAETPCSRFGKFTTIADPTSLWAADGKRLAEYAAQLAEEGGLDAAFEAPAVLAAMDMLADRARAWAARRQHALLERADLGAAAELASAEQAGRAAMRAVKEATTAALAEVAKKKEQQAATAALDAEFPALALAVKPATAPGAISGRDSAKEDESRQLRAVAPPCSDGGGGGDSACMMPAKEVCVGVPVSDVASTSAGSTLGSVTPETLGGSKGADDKVWFYQASDGQWLFLGPLSLRMLLHCYGSYAACPPTLTATLLEVEDVVQSEASRKRVRALAHLPLTASFRLCVVDLAPLLPPEAMEPFAEELLQRQKKRAQRARQAIQQAKREDAAAAAVAAAAANAGPSAAELRAMPQLGAMTLSAGAEPTAEGDDAMDAAAAEAAREREMGAGEREEGGKEGPPSFARIARLGFAATGPVVGAGGASPVVGAAFPAPSEAPAVAPSGVWGARTASAAAQAEPSIAPSPAAEPGRNGRGKKGGKQTLLFSTAQRRY